MEMKGTPCLICGRPFHQKSDARAHERTHMSKAEREEGRTYYYKCTLCPSAAEGQKGFRSKTLLQEHLAKEHPEEAKSLVVDTKPRKRRFFCPDCPFHLGFTRALALRMHIASGHGTKLWVREGKNCKICGKPCRDSTKARQHAETHSSSYRRRHYCHLCPTATTVKRALKRHYAREHRGTRMPGSFSETKKRIMKTRPSVLSKKNIVEMRKKLRKIRKKRGKRILRL